MSISAVRWTGLCLAAILVVGRGLGAAESRRAADQPGSKSRAEGGDTQPPAPPARQPAADGKDRRQYTSYNYRESAENMLKEVRLTIPEGLETVRGILVVSCGMGGDTRDAYREVWYGEFLHLHGFAFLGTKGFTSHVASLQVMQNALKQFAEQTGHPELVNAPFATTGFSAGGGFASRLLVEVPDRVIACVPVCSRLNFTGATPTAANLRTPACIISGEKEEKLPLVIEPVLEAYRPKGALFGWMTVQGGGHGRHGQDVLAMPLLDAAVRLRYPADADVRKGPVKLKTLDPNSGWVADNTTWKSGLTSIAPAKEFKGDVGKSSWLPTEDIAFIYRAYATYDKPLTIALESQVAGRMEEVARWPQFNCRALDPGSSVTIKINDSLGEFAKKFPRWKKLEFYDGARKLGQLTQGPTQFTATALAAGYHAFSVLGTGADGKVRPSNPAMVVVRKLPASPR